MLQLLFLSSIDGPVFGERNGYTARLSGYLVAPYTGEISFYLATSDQATLFVSNNTDPANRSKLKRYTNGRSDKLSKSRKCNSIFSSTRAGLW